MLNKILIDVILLSVNFQNGSCGIPPLLVQRYAEELRHDVWGIAAVMEQVRISQLLSYGREGVRIHFDTLIILFRLLLLNP